MNSTKHMRVVGLVRSTEPKEACKEVRKHAYEGPNLQQWIPYEYRFHRERPKHDDDNWEPHLVDHQMLHPKFLFRARHNPEPRSEVWWWNLRWSFGGKCFWRFSPAKAARKSPSKLRRKFATNFAENFANFTLESLVLIFSTSQYRSATTAEEFRCYIRCRFELLLLLLPSAGADYRHSCSFVFAQFCMLHSQLASLISWHAIQNCFCNPF